MTVDVYGRWLPSGNRTLIDQLDGEAPADAKRAAAAVGDSEPRGSKLVANQDSDENEAPEVPDSSITCLSPSTFYILNNLESQRPEEDEPCSPQTKNPKQKP